MLFPIPSSPGLYYESSRKKEEILIDVFSDTMTAKSLDMALANLIDPSIPIDLLVGLEAQREVAARHR